MYQDRYYLTTHHVCPFSPPTTPIMRNTPAFKFVIDWLSETAMITAVALLEVQPGSSRRLGSCSQSPLWTVKTSKHFYVARLRNSGGNADMSSPFVELYHIYPKTRSTLDSLSIFVTGAPLYIHTRIHTHIHTHGRWMGGVLVEINICTHLYICIYTYLLFSMHFY